MGSSAGTFEAFRVEMIGVVRAGRFRRGMVERRRAVPIADQYTILELAATYWDLSSTYQPRSLPIVKPLLMCLLPIEELKLDVGTRSSSSN